MLLSSCNTKLNVNPDRGCTPCLLVLVSVRLLREAGRVGPRGTHRVIGAAAAVGVAREAHGAQVHGVGVGGAEAAAAVFVEVLTVLDLTTQGQDLIAGVGQVVGQGFRHVDQLPGKKNNNVLIETGNSNQPTFTSSK